MCDGQGEGGSMVQAVAYFKRLWNRVTILPRYTPVGDNRRLLVTMTA